MRMASSQALEAPKALPLSIFQLNFLGKVLSSSVCLIPISSSTETLQKL